ncbi:aspartyl-phosphate phosphatase Spo0E family protein [Anoxybacter fermentans]|uniref:aspartyl-phosphate phosphatase Spo0E family protein n=1 Tax=Anoxybacter fermentans TaxID=1323375 RepID=UPI000F8CCDAC|nr:aspartyl-phosphate phosphatase Spo0E family protein [Anoxybacter fermentans]
MCLDKILFSIEVLREKMMNAFNEGDFTEALSLSQQLDKLIVQFQKNLNNSNLSTEHES